MKPGLITTTLLVTALLTRALPVFSQTIPLLSLRVSPDLPVAGDTVTVDAVPANFSATTTTYTWFRDGLPIAEASGLARSTLTIATDASQSQIIQVRVAVDPGPGFLPAEQSATIYTLPNLLRQQQEALSAFSSEFTLRASDTNPSPGESVDVEVVTFAFDKTAATYQWSVNGVAERDDSGRGRYRIALPGGNDGENKVVNVAVTTPAGDFRSKSVTIRTRLTSFYWWADTTVPYWYKGKALPSLGSAVTVLALPNVSDPSALTYQWQFNGSLLPQSSGVGRRTFTFSFAFPVEERIEVTMRDFAGAFTKTVGIAVKPVSPAVGIYELAPLRGIISENRLKDFSAPSGDPQDFVALPFFFPKANEQDLRYRWTLNGKEIVGAFVKPWLFTLTSKPGVPSADRLSIQVEDPTSREITARDDVAIDLR